MYALTKQYEFFQRNMTSLLENYNGKYLVIPESLEVIAFDTLSEAYKYGAKKYGLGNFLLQECNEEANQVQIISNLALGIA